MRFVLSGVLLLLCCAQQMFSQNNGQLNGSVRDQQGAAIPAADVEVLSPSTNTRFQVQSNESGEWVVPLLSSGLYRVTVKASGFRTAILKEIKVDAGTPSTVNVKREIGTVSETIEVTGGAEVLQTTNAGVQTTLSGRQIN